MADHLLTTAVSGDLLEITIAGRVTETNAEAIDTEVLAAVAAARPRGTLVDVRALAGRVGPGEAYFLVRQTARVVPESVLWTKMAIVDLEENMEKMAFFSTTAENVGRRIRFFTTREEALAWLAAAS